MKIEKISDNQIRCTLSRKDLSSRELKMSELAYGTEKAKSLFRDMIEQASDQFGFEADDSPLMIEAIPMSADCIVLIITKVEDPEELDMRFSKFAPAEDDSSDSYDTMDDSDREEDDEDGLDNSSNEEDFSGFEDLLKSLTAKIRAVSEQLKSEGFPDAPEDIPSDLVDNMETLPPVDSDKADAKEDSDSTAKAKEPIIRMYSFTSWDDAARASADIGLIDNLKTDSILYKNPVTNVYYLIVDNKGIADNELEFFKICNLLSEYGKHEKYNYATGSYLDEHCQVIIRENALDILRQF